MNKNSIFFQISAVLGIVVGILLCITLVGILFAIPLFIGVNKYFKWAKYSDEQLQEERDSIVIWGIVYTIFMFPIGAVALVPVFNMEGQLVGTQTKPSETDEKLDKINKLHKMKEEGILTEEEFKEAKIKILAE